MRRRPNPGITIVDGQPASDRLSTTSTVAQKLRNVERFRTVPVESCFQRSVAVFRSGEGADGDGTRLYPSPICRTCSIAANDGDKQSCQHGDKDRRRVVATGHTRRRHSCVWVVQRARWAATGGAQMAHLARAHAVDILTPRAGGDSDIRQSELGRSRLQCAQCGARAPGVPGYRISKRCSLRDQRRAWTCMRVGTQASRSSHDSPVLRPLLTHPVVRDGHVDAPHDMLLTAAECSATVAVLASARSLSS